MKERERQRRPTIPKPYITRRSIISVGPAFSDVATERCSPFKERCFLLHSISLRSSKRGEYFSPFPRYLFCLPPLIVPFSLPRGGGDGRRTSNFFQVMGIYELIKGEDAHAHVHGGGGGGEMPARSISNLDFLKMEEGCAALTIIKTPTEAAKKAATASEEDCLKPHTPKQRLVSLDVFRGITVALMILVDDAGGLLPAINHSPWDGVTLADFVMPFFLFIVGVALALAYKILYDKVIASRKAVLRAIKLFLVGLFLQGGFFHGLFDLTYGVDMAKIRWMGILQRIAIAYLVSSLSEIWLKDSSNVDSWVSAFKKYQYQWLVAFALSTMYMILLYSLYVSDWEYQIATGHSGSTNVKFSVKCGVRGDTSPACNAVGMIDRKVFGIQHLYKRPIYARTEQCSINSPDYGPLPRNAPSWCQAPFDPEGLLSSVMAIVTCLIGLHFGHIIIHYKEHKDRIIQWMTHSFSLIAISFFLELVGMHANKALYTFSYTCVTAGTAGILFVGIYVLVDVWGYRRPIIIFEYMGMHALMIYVLLACNILPLLIQGFYWKRPENNILRLIGIGS